MASLPLVWATSLISANSRDVNARRVLGSRRGVPAAPAVAP
jgi:hypothetical protein